MSEIITKITINNIASYKESTSLETDKRINLIYGLNGSGKTIMSNYLRNLEEDGFKGCSVEGFNKNNQKILVYNQKFVQENFYESSTQKGIFTVAKENKEALENIEKAIEEKSNLDDLIENNENGLNKLLEEKKKKIKLNSDTAQDETWEISREDKKSGDNSFDNNKFFQGLNTKDKLFKHVKNITLEEPKKTIDGIKKELEELEEEATERTPLPDISSNDFSDIEQNNIFQEEIIGDDNSTVANLIKELKNSDWVRAGLNFVDLGKRKNCPFCQQETLSDTLVEKIKNYFDKTYEDKINKLKELKEKYENSKQLVNAEEYKKNFFAQEENRKAETLFKNLEGELEKNLKQIETKINQPSKKITLKSSNDEIDKINKFIKERNEEIEQYNEKLRNKEKTKEELEEEFWKIQRKKYDNVITAYEGQDTKLQKEKKQIEEEIAKINNKIKEQEAVIAENQKKVTNIDETIEALNKHLLDFGIQDFSIAKCEKDKYRIKRKYEKEDNPIFESLSEGEKTVISFLYFVELCRGKETQEDNKDKIVVIDDPISSLSQIYIFNVAQLIKQYFTNTEEKKNVCKQCFVLTHSLYFFHGLTLSNSKKREEKQKLFRISKSNTSQIEEMGYDEIQNEYECYWHIVRTGKQENMPLIANVMRNIVEHFFGFIEASDLNNVFQRKEFQGNEFQTFYRYINRESHSDRTNIDDYKALNIEVFQKGFELLFTLSGYEKHYNKMARIDEKKNK